MTQKGNVLSNDIDGLDSEGLAIAPDGTFWVSDEYGPHIIHFDKTEILLKRLILSIHREKSQRFC